MATLFGRSCELTIGVPPASAPTAAKINSMVANGSWNDAAQGLAFDGFHIEFDISRNLKAEPNKAKIIIYNLSDQTRLALSGKTPLVVKLDVGFEGNNETIYLGTVRSAWTQKDNNGVDIIGHIESGDSEVNMQVGRIAYAQGPKAAKISITAALDAIVSALGVGAGNLLEAAPTFTRAGLAMLDSNALHGHAKQRLTDLCRSVGFSWSIQNGSIQILPIGGVLNNAVAIDLDSTTGLIGSPSVDSAGVLSATCLITPGLVPGTVVNMNALYVKGAYKVTQTRHYGATKGNDWAIDFQGVRYAV